jgi:hypothetical protein
MASRTHSTSSNIPATLDQSLPQCLTEHQVATILGWAVQSLRNDRCSLRRIPYLKLGRSVRYKLSDVLEFIEKHRIPARMTA